MKSKRGKKDEQEVVAQEVVSFIKKNKNISKSQVATTFNLARSSVYNIWNRYLTQGESNIKSKKRGAKEGWKLKPKQENLILNKIKNSAMMPPRVWTVAEVSELVTLKPKQVSRYLKKWGFLSQNTFKVECKKEPEQTQAIYNKQYLQIKKDARNQKAIILFGGKSGRKRMALENKNLFVQQSGAEVINKLKSEYYKNILSAITNKGTVYFSIFRGDINSEKIEEFLTVLQEQIDKSIIYVMNSELKTKRLIKWSDKNKNIKIHFLHTKEADSGDMKKSEQRFSYKEFPIQ